MELRLLRYFLTIAQEGSISQAAHVLPITQPTLSCQIQMLETELGTRFFDRGQKKDPVYRRRDALSVKSV